MRTDKKAGVAAALILSALMAPSVWAVESEAAKPPAPKPAAAAPAPVLMTAEGSVSELDLKAGTLKLTDAVGKSWTLGIETSGTTAWKASRFLPLAELKTGDQVKVRYVTKEGKRIARLIDVQTAGAANAPVPAARK